jgi:hypothetical protein
VINVAEARRILENARDNADSVRDLYDALTGALSHLTPAPSPEEYNGTHAYPDEN